MRKSKKKKLDGRPQQKKMKRKLFSSNECNVNWASSAWLNFHTVKNTHKKKEKLAIESHHYFVCYYYEEKKNGSEDYHTGW